MTEEERQPDRLAQDPEPEPSLRSEEPEPEPPPDLPSEDDPEWVDPSLDEASIRANEPRFEETAPAPKPEPDITPPLQAPAAPSGYIPAAPIEWPEDVPRPKSISPSSVGPCMRCGYVWVPRASTLITGKPPKCCARCRSSQWDVIPPPGSRPNKWWKNAKKIRESHRAAVRRSWLKTRLRQVASQLGPDTVREVLADFLYRPPLPFYPAAPTEFATAMHVPLAASPSPVTSMPSMTGVPTQPPDTMPPPPARLAEPSPEEAERRRRELLESLYRSPENPWR